MIRITSTGSVWFLDEDLKRYLRLPKQEGPRTDEFGRQRPDWGSDPGACKDGDWHPYERWLYVWTYAKDAVMLVIEYPAAGCTAELKGLTCQNKHFIRTGILVDPEGNVVIPVEIDEENTLTAAEHELAYAIVHDPKYAALNEEIGLEE